ncbi:hypothetical protein FISHEDRAFT_53597 [Fistulina hepatica ATCC 64428]|nr:hypothetical protein FISHEDRAFT_53597 [Fistulina hepatica ATCC 64428]
MCPAEHSVRVDGSSTNTQNYLIRYTGIYKCDYAVCVIVAFWHLALNHLFTSYFISQLAPLAIIPIVEDYRTTRTIRSAVALLLLSQITPISVTMPLWWSVFIWHGRTHPAILLKDCVDPETAQALLFSFIVGYAIPSIGMCTAGDPVVTALWQPYALWVYLAYRAHLLVLPSPEKLDASAKDDFKVFPTGINTLRILYIGTFIVCSSFHMSSFWPKLHESFTTRDMSSLRQLFNPSLSPLVGRSSSEQAVDFLYWDGIFSFASTALATAWFASTVRQVCVIALWYIVAIPLLGPGAAIMATAVWRDRML